MRIWKVPFGELDNQRILGQHQEVHALHGLIVRRMQPWGGLTWEDELYLIWVHAKTVEECKARGWPSGTNHQTPLGRFTQSERATSVTFARLGTIRPWDERLARDRTDLIERWGGFYKGRVEAPYDYVPVIGRYWDERTPT